MQLIADTVRELLDYNPSTGELRWKVCRNNRTPIGQIAGYLSDEGYLVIGLFKKNFQAHRVAWLLYYGVWPEHQVDHINQCRADNRIHNLRDATHSVNQRNRRKQKTNTSGFNGVSQTASGNWIARIRLGDKTINLGTYPTIEEAAIARAKADAVNSFHQNHGR